MQYLGFTLIFILEGKYRVEGLYSTIEKAREEYQNTLERYGDKISELRICRLVANLASPTF